MRSTLSFHIPLHRLRISSRRRGEFRPPARRRVRDWRKRRTDKRPCGCDETHRSKSTAGRLACKSGQHDAAPALVCQRSEWLGGIARRVAAFEYHFVATGFETFDPPHERRCAVEKRRFTEHADERDWQTDAARMIQNPSAIVQRAIDLGNRKQPRLCQVFLLHIHKHDDRNARRICKCPKAYD